MVTGSILKIADVPKTGFSTDSMMQMMRDKNAEKFSFVFIGNYNEIIKMTVRRELADLCLV